MTRLSVARTLVQATLLSVCGLLAVKATSCSKPPGNRLNVVLVTLDTTRADYFGSYGYPEDTTPNFDALAAEGVRFALAVSTSAVTPVSHASILTGLNQYGHGLRVLAADGGFRLPPEIPTVSGVLKDAGYRTAAIHSAFPVSAHFGFDRGYDVFESFDAEVTVGRDRLRWDVTEAQRRSDETTDIVLDFLGRTKKPFLLWVHYWDPHDPVLVPPDEYLPEDLPRTDDGRIPPSSALYAAELRFVDAQFGRLVAALKRRGMWADTLVLVVSDHGEGLEDGLERHGWEFHRILYQEQIHVPLILRVPGTGGGRVVEDLVSTIDIYPTILDYLDLEAPRPVEGRSLRALVEGLPDAPRIAYADQVNLFDLNAAMLKRRPQSDFEYCAMDARWKLIYRPTRPDESELYDIRADPLELKNLYREEPAEASRLLLELARRDGWVLEPFELEGGGSSEASQAMLTALGYTASDPDDPDAEGEPLLRWEWRCPLDWRALSERKPCSECGSPPVPVGVFEHSSEEHPGR